MKVLFIQPSNFLRSKEGTNPFFDPLIDVLDRAGIEYEVMITDGDRDRFEKCGYHRKMRLACLTYCQIQITRVLRILFRLAPDKAERFAGRMLRPFCSKLFACDLCVTLSGVYSDFLFGMKENLRVVDLQHGVVYSRHRGYFCEDGVLRSKWRVYKSREFWLYGWGYADCFFRNPENHKWLDGRVKVIGDLLGENRGGDAKMAEKRSDVIAVSLQFTNDGDLDNQQSWADDLCKVFMAIENSGLQNQYPVLMRHHPRYNGDFDMGPMMKRFPWLQLTEELTNALIAKAAYHITYMSTSAFEYAAEGVPTLFTASEKNRVSVDMMYVEFDYPIPLEFQQMANALNDEKELARQGELVKAWYKKFYTPFDAKNCLELLKGEA